MGSGVWIIEESVQLPAGIDLLHFNLIPALDRALVLPSDNSITERKITPSNTASAGWRRVQKQRIGLRIFREQFDVSRSNPRSISGAIRHIRSINDPQLEPLRLQLSTEDPNRIRVAKVESSRPDSGALR